MYVNASSQVLIANSTSDGLQRQVVELEKQLTTRSSAFRMCILVGASLAAIVYLPGTDRPSLSVFALRKSPRGAASGAEESSEFGSGTDSPKGMQLM